MRSQHRHLSHIFAAAALICLLFCSGGCARQTPPPQLLEEQQDSLVFLFFSDAQADPQTGDYGALGELLTRAIAQAPQTSLVIFGGDTVNDGGAAGEWQAFWQAAATPLAGLTTAAVAGNHDNQALLAQQFAHPQQAPSNQGEGFFYSFDMGPLHFIMLDSNIMGAARPQDIEWLQNDLQSAAAQQAAWRIAVMHHPLWPPLENPKDVQRAATMREYFLPLLETNGVDLLLTGHQHNYALSLPTDGRGITQIMAASGGKGSYAMSGAGQAAAQAPAPNYLLLTADSAKLTVTAYDGQNAAFDTYTLDKDKDAWRIRVSGPAGYGLWSFTEAELAATQFASFSHIYSSINNWPTSRFYAAAGYKVADILQAAGLWASAQTVTFRAADGYQVSFTREQLLAPQYCFPQVGENDSGAEQVYPIIAYRWREGADDLSGLRDDKPSLIMGQRNTFEHNNPAFVIGVTEIVVDAAPGAQWPEASTFPLPGPIAGGETVKLQHPDFGLVKLHYTLDGSEPTLLSPMYNPSTYQPELNKPIPITEPTVIKVLVSGYGKEDSEIAVFEFTPQ